MDWRAVVGGEGRAMVRGVAAVAVAAIVAAAMGGVGACPYIVETNPPTNFTAAEIGAAISTATIMMRTLVVCNGAVVPANATIPPIISPLVVRGEVLEDGAAASWDFEDFLSPVIWLISSPGVEFSSLQISCGTTFARVIGAGSVVFRDFKFGSGVAGIEIAATPPLVLPNPPGPVNLTTGVDCDRCYFDTTITGVILETAAPFRCAGCQFIDNTDAGVLSLLPDATSHDAFFPVGVVFANTINALATQFNDNPLPKDVSDVYAFQRNLFSCTSFSEADCPEATPAFGGAASNCDCPPILDRDVQILLVITALAILLTNLLCCIFSKNRQRPVNLKFEREQGGYSSSLDAGRDITAAPSAQKRSYAPPARAADAYAHLTPHTTYPHLMPAASRKQQ